MADDGTRDRALAPTAQMTANSELTTGSNVGGYVIERKVGEGGMGVVYSAQQPRIGKRVAIKVLAPAFCGDPVTVERFEQEARLVNEIHHPGIVDVFQFGELPDGRSFFVMEFLDGESLGDRLDRGPLPAAEAIEILDVIVDALEAAHEKGVVHRDLKSDNVFLVKERGKLKVKLLDFGLAKLARNQNDPAALHKTKSGILVGTPAYMSPEQARGKQVDHRTDIYALGCLSFKMLTGHLPFIADNAMDLIVKQLHDDPPPAIRDAPKTPVLLSRVVQRMMAKTPEERPTLAEIREVLAKLRAPKPTASSRSDAAKPRRLALSLLIGLMLFCSGVLAVGLLVLWKQGESRPPAVAPAAGSAATTSAPAQPQPQPGATPPATIEFEDDTVRAARAKAQPSVPPPPADPTGAITSPAATGSAQPSGDGSAAAAGSAESAPAKFGVIVLTLEHTSKIKLDGRVVSEDSKGGRFEVPPGPHTLEIKASGREAVIRTIEIAAGETSIVQIVDADTAAKPKKPKPERDDGVYDPSTDDVVPQD